MMDLQEKNISAYMAKFTDDEMGQMYDECKQYRDTCTVPVPSLLYTVDHHIWSRHGIVGITYPTTVNIILWEIAKRACEGDDA